jgi:hypothetical protein
MVAVRNAYAAPTGLCPSPSGWERVAVGRVRVYFVVLQLCRAYGAPLTPPANGAMSSVSRWRGEK